MGNRYMLKLPLSQTTMLLVIWLPMENDFLKSYPISGLNEEKLLKSMEKVGKSSKSLPIGDLIKNADEIDHNNKIAAEISSQANHIKIFLCHFSISFYIHHSNHNHIQQKGE